MSGSPKYWIGKLTLGPVKSCSISSMLSPAHLIVATVLFARLIFSPVASQKALIISIMRVTSSRLGLVKITASSAYIEILMDACRPLSFVRRSSCVARLNMLLRTSIARMNRYGDRGSPCLSPLRCLKLLPGLPLSNIEDDEVFRIAASQFVHLIGKPLFTSSSSKNSHETESNALVMSNLIRQAGVFVP